VLVGSATTSPYSVTWNSGSVTAGGHNLYAVATDTAGLTTTSSTVAITVATGPTVSITSPAANATVTGSISITASASDAVGIKKVDFYRDAGVLVGTATTSPYTVTWNSGSVTAGGHSLYAVATDTADLTTTSSTVAITVTTTSGAISIVSPAPNSVVWGTVSVTASVSGSGIQKVDFYLDSTVLIGTATTAPYTVSWNTGSAAAGQHNLSVIATISGSNSFASTAVPVTVDPPPAISISTDANATNLTKRSTATITAAVTQGGFPISRVDFLVNSTVVCSDTTAPYNCAWQVPAAAGKTYQLSAKAYDTQGQAAVSNVITVSAH